jgi:hypothetical protein
VRKKQAEVPNNRELNSDPDIPDDPRTMSGRVLETRPEVDKEEGFEDTTEDTTKEYKDTVKQNKAFFNREEVPEARTGVTRKTNSRHEKNWRLKKLTPMLLLILLHLQVGNHNEVMKKNNPRKRMRSRLPRTSKNHVKNIHPGSTFEDKWDECDNICIIRVLNHVATRNNIVSAYYGV